MLEIACNIINKQIPAIRVQNVLDAFGRAPILLRRCATFVLDALWTLFGHCWTRARLACTKHHRVQKIGTCLNVSKTSKRV